MPTPSYEEIAEAIYEVGKILARKMDPGYNYNSWEDYNYNSWEDLTDEEQDVNIAAAKIVFSTIEDYRVAEIVARDIQANSEGEEVIDPPYSDGAIIAASNRLDQAMDFIERKEIFEALWNQAYKAGINDLIDECELD